jgi:hypothetical protein
MACCQDPPRRKENVAKNARLRCRKLLREQLAEDHKKTLTIEPFEARKAELNTPGRLFSEIEKKAAARGAGASATVNEAQ